VRKVASEWHTNGDMAVGNTLCGLAQHFDMRDPAVGQRHELQKYEATTTHHIAKIDHVVSFE
jgi:hypothetical protein